MQRSRRNSNIEGKRVDPSNAQRKQLRHKNAHVCCICKERNIGDNFHHIDGDSSNTVDDNLAVLCVRHHDNHHRPNSYNHTNLSNIQIRTAKQNWEAFVEEARKDIPRVFATISIFGTEEKADSMKLLFCWEDGTIEFERVYHAHLGTPEKWIDFALDEIHWLGDNLKLVLIDTPLDIDYCPHCEHSISYTVDPNLAKKINAENWIQDSICSIYINPDVSSLTILIFLGNDILYQANIHICGERFHYLDGKNNEFIDISRKPSVRTQVTNLVMEVLTDWAPGNILIGTGNADKPTLISDLNLPNFWELTGDTNT